MFFVFLAIDVLRMSCWLLVFSRACGGLSAKYNSSRQYQRHAVGILLDSSELPAPVVAVARVGTVTIMTFSSCDRYISLVQTINLSSFDKIALQGSYALRKSFTNMAVMNS